MSQDSGENAVQEEVTFTRSGLLIGALEGLPVALSAFAFGFVFGVLARQAGLSLLEVTLMSGFVFAGSAQLIALELWTAPLPVLAIILTTLIVNLRYLLLSAALRTWFSKLPTWKAYGSVFFMADENWALTMRDLQRGSGNGAYLLGSGLCLFVCWVSSTFLGHTVGGAVVNPAQWGLDFVSTAIFVALLVAMWKGKSNLLPWAVAAVVAIVSAQLIPGKWYILFGSISGSIVGAWRDAD